MKPFTPPFTTKDAANRQFCYFTLTLFAWFAVFAWQAHGAATLPLDAFLDQVKAGNTGVKGAIETSVGAAMRSVEGDLLTSPNVFSTVQYTHDGKPPAVPLYSYSFQNTSALTLGISQLTDFGLSAKLSYNLLSFSLENPNFGSGTSSGASSSLGSSYNTATTLELTQSLWGNGFGRATRANEDLLKASALATSYANLFNARVSLADAEAAYWRLATARQAVALSQDNYERAQKTYAWSARRVRLHLTDKSDELQASAQLQARKLEYQRALDDERTAAIAFNTARGVDSEAVPERLSLLTPEAVLRMTPPARVRYRDDVKAAEQQQLATQASAELSVERDKPTLEVFGSLALNGKDPLDFTGNPNLGQAAKESFSFAHPTAAIGVRFQAPLDFGAQSAVHAGYQKEQDAATLIYQRKLFEQERTWKDLSQRWVDAKRRLELATQLEKIQQAKLVHERDRLQAGRSTTFQVLTFETDYAVAELNRIQAESEVLGILTQMKLFGEVL